LVIKSPVQNIIDNMPKSMQYLNFQSWSIVVPISQQL